MDLAHHDDARLRQAAALIRRFHDLGAELLDNDAARAVGIEVVCHNDLSPCNFVFRDDTPVAIIDFDACAPGTRRHDLGCAAWLWLDIGNPDTAVEEQARRLTVFLDAYGPVDRDGLLTAMQVRQAMLIAEGRRRGDTAMAEWAQACLGWTDRNIAVLSRATGQGASSPQVAQNDRLDPDL